MANPTFTLTSYEPVYAVCPEVRIPEEIIREQALRWLQSQVAKEGETAKLTDSWVDKHCKDFKNVDELLIFVRYNVYRDNREIQQLADQDVICRELSKRLVEELPADLVDDCVYAAKIRLEDMVYRAGKSIEDFCADRGITEEQLNWIMQENGNDVNREKSAATALQAQLDNANVQLKTAQDGLKAFEGKKKPEEYEAELTKLQADMKAQADGFAFDSALNTAILGKKGRSVKAVRALLDLDALKGSKDRSADIDKALDDAAKANPWAFGEDGAAGVAVVSTGAEHGAPPANESNGVEAAFKSLNPELNL